MKFALISPRLAVQKGDFLGSGVPYWPVELAVTAGFLRDKGHEIQVLDLFGSEPDSLEEKDDHYLQGKSIRRFYSEQDFWNNDVYFLFAISYMSHQEILEIIRCIKQQKPGAKIVILENSQAVTAYAVDRLAKDFFSYGADYLLCGEPYFNWDEIQAKLDQPDLVTAPENLISPESIDSGRVALRKIVKHPSYPAPAWELFNLANYWKLPYSHGPKRAVRYLPILTSRGCPYPCDFCVVPSTNNQRWRGRAAQEVVAEMLYLRDKFGVSYFQIEDLNPTVQSVRWGEICNRLISAKARIHFAFVSGTKAETLKLELIPLLAQAGCHYLSISPESGSAKVLKAIGKPFDYAHALKVIETCKDHGIYTQACLLVGHPSENEEDHRMSCEYLRKMVRAGLSEVAVFVVSSLAGSKLHENSAIELSSSAALPSFSPKGRAGYVNLVKRRKELIRIFFIEKLRQGSALWLQGIRSLLGRPRTKMENLPLRVVFIIRLLLRRKITRFRPDHGA